MSAQSSEVNDQASRPRVRAARTKAAPGRVNAYELRVIASDVDDAVRSAGGWLFDRVMAGWAVHVAVPDASDIRPLQILGVKVSPLETGLESMLDGAESVAVSAGVFDADAHVRQDVASALHRGREVTVWGGILATRLDHRLHHVQHPLSAAAQAFKAQALLATADSRTSIRSTESFLSCAGWYASDCSDLMPVS
jgi:hypothetical protein